MENLIVIGLILVIIYQIYATHKNVNKLVKEVEELKIKIDQSKNDQL